MHTFSTDGWHIHHDGGQGGDVIVTRERPDRVHQEFGATSEEVLAAVRAGAGLARGGLSVPPEVLASFVADRHVRPRLMSWLEGASDEQLLKLLRLLDGLTGAQG